MIESGYPDFVVRAFFGLVAPNGTPAPIVDKLNATINAEMTSKRCRPRSGGWAPRPARERRPTSRLHRGRAARWSAVAKTANISID